MCFSLLSPPRYVSGSRNDRGLEQSPSIYMSVFIYSPGKFQIKDFADGIFLFPDSLLYPLLLLYFHSMWQLYCYYTGLFLKATFCAAVFKNSFVFTDFAFNRDLCWDEEVRLSATCKLAV